MKRPNTHLILMFKLGIKTRYERELEVKVMWFIWAKITRTRCVIWGGGGFVAPRIPNLGAGRRK
jgi:polysaccharide pyruvyl transferase WcaK-like protein